MTSFTYQPGQYLRTIKVRRGTLPNRLGDTSLEHLLAGGLPVNPAHLREIRLGVSNGPLARDREQLVREVQRDPGLVVHCARTGRGLAGDADHPVDPFHLLRGLEEEKLATLFPTSETSISSHRLRRANPAQASRLQHAIISVSAAHCLAPELEVEPDLAYSASLFRELGLALISWNYPQMYSRVMSSFRRSGVDVDTELLRIFGMTSQDIGRRLARDWGMPPEVLAAWRSENPNTPRREGQANLSEVCDIADLFAQSKDPVHFPRASALWQAKEQALSATLGASFRERLDSEARESLECFVGESPALEKLPLVQQISKERTGPPLSKTIREKNPFLERCPSDVQAEISTVYGEMYVSGVSVDAIRRLADYAVLACGFDRGCVYLLHSTTRLLTPALRIGDVPLSAYHSHPLKEHDDIGASMFSGIPCRSEGEGIQGDRVSRIMGSLENHEHQGVLYLELSKGLAEESNRDALTIFQALRQAFDDAFSS